MSARLNLRLIVLVCTDYTGESPEQSRSEWVAKIILNGTHGHRQIWRESPSDRLGELTESKGTVTITSVTEKNVKVSFSAALHSYNPDTKVAKELTISRGSFDVPLKRREFDLKNYE